MPNWNPNAPEVLGMEWFPTHLQEMRVWGGSYARHQRLISTSAETIASLHLSVKVNEMLRYNTRTLIDVCVEGNEDTPLFQPVDCVPVGDFDFDRWHKGNGSFTDLWQNIDEDAQAWPGPAQYEWIETDQDQDTYMPILDVSAFAGGGSHQNARIGFVEVLAIYGANEGFRKMWTGLRVNAPHYEPAGGGYRDVHYYGAPYVFRFGEINPDTNKPWIPADIVKFGSTGTSRILATSQYSSSTHWVKIYALRLRVWCIPTDNRVAVGVWKRPDNLTTALNNVETDALITVPSGAANWSKANATNYTFFFRQATAPSLYQAVNADDVRWMGAYQHLGPAGNPKDIVYPLYDKGHPAPSTVLASQWTSYDQFGRPELYRVLGDGAPLDPFGTGFVGNNEAAGAIALERNDAAMSADSQPYRLDYSDIQLVKSTQKLGQRIVPSSSQSYIGVRFPICPWPLNATGNPTLTVAIFRVSDSVQMGGTFTITSDVVKAMPAADGVWRYVSGFLSSAAALVSGTAYEIRVSTSSEGEWMMPMPDCSLAPTTGFGGTTNGAFIGATHQPNKDLDITITRQPDPPTAVTAAIVNKPVSTWIAEEITTVQHVNLSWTQPAVGMGSLFARYEIEREVNESGVWHRVANAIAAGVVFWEDREAPRASSVRYRMRAVGKDGRFSAYNQSGIVQPRAPGAIAVFTSNHMPSLEVVYGYDLDASYPILSADGDETVFIHGADYQVVFVEYEDRGVGWHTNIEISRLEPSNRGGIRVSEPLVNLVRSLDIPYVCVMDNRGMQILGHVDLREIDEKEPGYKYSADIDVIPTHTEPVPVEITI